MMKGKESSVDKQVSSAALREAVVRLQEWLPERLFDAHAHIFRTDTLSSVPEGLWAPDNGVVSPAVWRRALAVHVGKDRLQGALFLPEVRVRRDKISAVNRWMLRMAASVPGSRALVLVTPEMTRQDVDPLLDHQALAGFKVYHLYSTSRPTWDAPPADYIPEWVWPLADENRLALTLHLVRAGAMADAENQRYIREHCERFPGAQLILAHAGRAFHAPNAAAGAAGLEGLPNLWFDTAAVCESGPLLALLEAFGPRRLLWGTDFPICESLGRCVTAGDSFVWLSQHHVQGTVPAVGLWPVALESLRAHREAAETFGLDRDDLRDLFAGNAYRLLKQEPVSDGRTQTLYRKAKELIPGGTQLLSKRPEMMAPGQWPAYFREARGCEVWDLDGRHYYDFSTNGIGACLLGFRDPDVTRAVMRRVRLGSMSTLNPPEEVELAERLCAIHPWAEQVRFARCGGEICAVAVRIARATTDRSVVAICGYSGWQDWYLAANLGESDALRGHLLPGLDPLGVPRELRGTTVPFIFNDRAGFQALLDEHGERLAAVIMEPCRGRVPEPGFLEFVRDGAHRTGALLIFDEISIGWRLCFGGAHLKYGVNPDLAVFAKAMGNGHPIAAVIGTRAAMAGAQGSFISSTYWTESVGPAAALATLRKMESTDVSGHVARIGSRIQSLWGETGRRHGLPVVPDGFSCMAHLTFDHPAGEILRTLFTQEMLARGFLAGAAVYPTLAHTEKLLDRYAEALDAVFASLAKALASGEPERFLKGDVAHSGFRRLT